MAIVNSAIYDEIVNQISRAPRPAAYRLEGFIVANGVMFEALKVISEDGMRQFENGFSDEILLTLQFNVATFERYLWPNRQKLKAVLKASPIGESSNQDLISAPILERKYDAILVETRDTNLQGLPNYDPQMGLGDYQFQLVNPAVQQFRLMTGGSNFHQQKPADVVKGLLTYLSKQIKVTDDYAIKGVEMWPADNAEVSKHVIVPATTPAPNIPGYIQKYAGGVYNHGIGFYLHRNVWYVYPLYDHTRYERAPLTLDLFIVPHNRSTGLNRTFQFKDGRLQVAITGDVRHKDSTDIQHLTSGNGVRFMKATETFNNFATVKGNRAYTDPSKTTAQFLINKRKGEYQALKLSSNPITDNVAHEMSKLAARSGHVVLLIWENSRPDLLIPGMPVKIYYGVESGYETLVGTLLTVSYVTMLDTPGVTGERYRTTSSLYVFVNKPLPSKA